MLAQVAESCFNKQVGLSDRVTDHCPMLFVHNIMVRRPAGRSVVLIETAPRSQQSIANLAMNRFKNIYYTEPLIAYFRQTGFTSGELKLPSSRVEVADAIQPLPVRVLDSGDVSIQFCCRQDGDSSVPARFPTPNPFILFKVGLYFIWVIGAFVYIRV